jgi:protein O-GlcNAc transferase
MHWGEHVSEHKPVTAASDDEVVLSATALPPDTGEPRRSAIAELLRLGLADHQAGCFQRAESRYRRVLTLAPDHPDALHLLGILSYQHGRHKTAAELIGTALRYKPNDASYHNSLGLALQGLGRVEDAIARYDQALLLQPDFAEALINRGLALEALGRPGEALVSHDNALALRPASIEAWHNRGNTLQVLGRFAEAVESYDRALALNPGLAQTCCNRGSALRALRRWQDAVASYDRALDLDPDYVEALRDRGDSLQALGRIAEAVDSYARAAALKPDEPELLFKYSNALRTLGRVSEALESYERALALKPDYAEVWNNRGSALQVLGRFREALDSYDKAIACRPEHILAILNRGSALQALQRYDEALECYDRVRALRPDDAETALNRGGALHGLGRFTEALDSYQRALQLRPGYAAAFLNRGNTLQEMQRLPEALESYRQVLALRPDHAAGHFNLGRALRRQGNLKAAIDAFSRAAALNADYAVGHWFNTRQHICDWSNFHDDEAKARNALMADDSTFAPFALLALSSTAQQQLDCARRVSGSVAVVESDRIAHPQRLAGDRIRLGYICGEFHQHPVSSLIVELIERHDRRCFEVAAYSYGPDDGSAMRARLTHAFDRFVDIRSLTHRAAARAIAADKIDILIDLSGYTGDCRTAILAYRPAPLQVNFLGFPATMGAEFIDYIIVDRFVVPPDQQRFYSEKMIYLPECYQPTDTTRKIADAAPSRRECGLPDHGVVFCCFNNSWKLTPVLFDVWMRLLRAVPDSVLWLLDANPWAKANLAAEAAARDVAPQRLVFAPRLAAAEHLARHQRADLFLDTLPYNAHTTASDALWAGLPVLTCVGHSFSARVAASLLNAIGLGELATASLTEYEQLALRLAREPDELTQVRARLWQNRHSHALFDCGHFARSLEAGYHHMWANYRAGRSPAVISVTPAGATGPFEPLSTDQRLG